MMDCVQWTGVHYLVHVSKDVFASIGKYVFLALNAKYMADKKNVFLLMNDKRSCCIRLLYTFMNKYISGVSERQNKTKIR